MPTKSKSKQVPQTLRQHAKMAQDTKPKTRRIKTVSGKAKGTIGRLFKLIGRTLKPLSFLLIPLKTKPFRMVGNVLFKVFLIDYLRSSFKELKQVNWPNRRETIRLTTAVILFAIVFGVMIAVVDFGFDKLVRKVFL